MPERSGPGDTAPFASAAEAALDALVRQLIAASDSPDSAPGLAETLVEACRGLTDLAVPRDLREGVERLAVALKQPRSDEQLAAWARRAHAALADYRAPGWRETLLARPTSVLPGVGPKRAAHFAARGLRTVADVLFHLPVRYDDRRSLVRIEDLQVGRHATFIAEVRSAESSHVRGRQRRLRRIFQAVVADDTGSIQLKWFRGADALEAWLAPGARVLVTGDVKRYRFALEIVHPEVERIEAGEELTAPAKPEGEESAALAALEGLRRIVAEYTTPEGVSPRALRRLIASALAEYLDLVPGYLPPSLVRERGLPPVGVALRRVHEPEPEADVEAARAFSSSAHQRLVLEELYLLELGLALRREGRSRWPGVPLDVELEVVRAAPSTLPFRLTAAQRRSWGEIRGDLARSTPMNRLLQGDVGSGKTVMAYLAAVAAAVCGKQSALMAPTELLAEQHARTLGALAASADGVFRLRIALLSASVPRAEADAVKRAIAAGEVDLVVGTHALLQPDVGFARLAVAVVDEQHRFGVRQRQALAQAGEGGRVPHTLVMTATPIPRTLALSLYGDLDVSVIDELPPGRAATKTLVFRPGEGDRVANLVRETTARGEQVYVVYPLVEESEKLDLRSAMQSAERIRASFPECQVDIVHGRLDGAARSAAMARFERGETQILVSTTVIEVGVDVAGATLMIVEHAERFGLAQLHQLRGRVGRGERAGTCALVARGGSEDGEARLRAMLETTDGFAIADADLRIRGPGEFLGTRQHGRLPDLRIADLVRDARLVSIAREAALATVRSDPGLGGDPELRDAVERRWGDRLSLVGVG